MKHLTTATGVATASVELAPSIIADFESEVVEKSIAELIYAGTSDSGCDTATENSEVLLHVKRGCCSGGVGDCERGCEEVGRDSPD